MSIFLTDFDYFGWINSINMRKLIILITFIFSVSYSNAQQESVEKNYLAIKMTDNVVQDLNDALDAQQTEAFNKNLFSWKMSDMIFQRLSFTYQHIFGEEGKIAIYIPVSFYFGDRSKNADIEYSNYFPLPSFNEDESDYYIGLGAKIFPMGQRKAIDFYVGTAVRFGEATSIIISDMYDGETSYEPLYIETSYSYSAFLINPGVNYIMMNRFMIGAELGYGIFLDQSNSLKTITQPVIEIGISF